MQCTLVDKPLSLTKSLMSRKANEFSEISQVYFRAGWKELTEVVNWLSSSLLDKVAPTQSSMKRLQRSGLFTVYKQKPVGTNGKQTLPNGKFSWDRRVPFTKSVQGYRESLEGGKIMGVCKHVFRLEIPFGNFGLPFKKSRFLRKFSVWESQNRRTINLIFQPKLPDFCGKW